MSLTKKGGDSSMSRIASVMVMHARDRATWFMIPWLVVGSGFVICLFIALFSALLMGHQVIGGTYTGALATFYFMMLIGGVTTVSGSFPFAVGFGTLRRDYFLGTLSIGILVSAAWAILLGLLSLIEANVFKNWGVDLHFFHLPFLSDGAPLRQFCWTTSCTAQAGHYYFRHDALLQQLWVAFVLLMFLYLLGMLLGSIYQRFGRTGEYLCFGAALLLLSVFLLVITYGRWWGVIFGWLAQLTAATVGLWLVPLLACLAIASYMLLRKAAV